MLINPVRAVLTADPCGYPGCCPCDQSQDKERGQSCPRCADKTVGAPEGDVSDRSMISWARSIGVETQKEFRPHLGTPSTPLRQRPFTACELTGPLRSHLQDNQTMCQCSRPETLPSK